MENLMNKANGLVKGFKIGLVIGFLTALTGCAGFWGGGYYHSSVIVSEPDEYLFGGVYYNGHDEHYYSHRGHESRGEAHSGRNHGRKR